MTGQDTCGVLVVLQAIDAGGKDGTIRHVMSGVTRKVIAATLIEIGPRYPILEEAAGRNSSGPRPNPRPRHRPEPPPTPPRRHPAREKRRTES
jgi:hypothetical protein